MIWPLVIEADSSWYIKPKHRLGKDALGDHLLCVDLRAS